MHSIALKGDRDHMRVEITQMCLEYKEVRGLLAPLCDAIENGDDGDLPFEVDSLISRVRRRLRS